MGLTGNRRELCVAYLTQATECAAGSERFEYLAVGFVAHGADHAVAGQQGLLGKGAAESTADTGDEEKAGRGHEGAFVVGRACTLVLERPGSQA